MAISNNNKITAKQQKIRKQPNLTDYKPEKIAIDTKYPAAKSKQDTLTEGIDRNLQRLQNVSADPLELQKNLDKVNPQKNFFFEALRALNAPMDWITTLLTVAVASEEEKLELGIDGNTSGLDVANEVFLTGSPKAMGDEPWMTANLFQTMFGKGVSTDDWSPVTRMLLSMGTDMALDPMNLILNPVFGGIAKGVKATGKGVTKAVGKGLQHVPKKAVKAVSNAVRESEELLSSGFRQAAKTDPKIAREFKKYNDAQKIVAKYDDIKIKNKDIQEPSDVKKAREFIDSRDDSFKLEAKELEKIDLTSPEAKAMYKQIQKVDKIRKPTNDMVRSRLREANKNKTSFSDVTKYVEDALGIKTRKNRVTEVSKEQSISMNKTHEAYFNYKKQANRLLKDQAKPFRDMFRGKNTDGTEAVLQEMKKQGLISKGLDVADIKGNKQLIESMQNSYLSHILTNELETNAKGFLQMSLPDLFSNVLEPNNIDRMSPDVLRKVQRSLKNPDDKQILASEGVVSINLEPKQLDRLVSTLMKQGIIPEASRLDDYIRYYNVGTKNDPLYNIFTTDALINNWNKLKEMASTQALNNPRFMNYVKNRYLGQEQSLKGVEKLFKNFGDPHKYAEVKTTQKWLTDWVEGNKGISLDKWNRLKPTIEQYNPKLAEEIGKIIKLSLIKYKKLSKRKVVKPTKDLAKLNEIIKTNPKIKKLFNSDWEVTADKALKGAKGNKIFRKGQSYQGSDTELSKLLNKTTKELNDTIESTYKSVQDGLNQMLNVGKKYSKSEDPFIRKQIRDLKTNILDKRIPLMKDLGAGEANIADFLYHMDFRGKALTDSVGSPLTKNYLAKVSRSDSEIRSIKHKTKTAPAARTQKDKWIAEERAVTDSKFIGRSTEINKAIRYNEAKTLIQKGIINTNQSASRQMEDALKMASKYDLFITNPLVSANKAMSAAVKTWGDMGVITKSIENNLIIPGSKISTKDFKSNRFVLLDETSLGNTLARGDKKYARKLASGEKITSKDITDILKNQYGDVFGDKLKFDGNNKLKESFYIDRRVNQLIVNASPSEEEAKIFLKVFDNLLVGWKKVVLTSVGYLFRLVSGDIMHGMISGIPLGHMSTGWAKGLNKVNAFAKAQKQLDAVSMAAINSKSPKIQAMLEKADVKEMDTYFRSQLDKKWVDLLDEKRDLLEEGVLSGGQFTQDKALGGILNPKDGEIMFDKIMSYHIKKTTNPKSIAGMKGALRGTNKVISDYIRMGQHSAEAARLSAYWYFNSDISKLKRLKGKFGVGKAELDAAGNKLPITKNFQAAGYDSVMEATDFALYGNRRLSGFEQKYMTRMMPFYSFFRFSLEQNLKSAMKGKKT